MTDSAAAEPKELPCIWVQAGVLSYRLCDRDYDCENCELYHALHGSGSFGSGKAASAPEFDRAESSGRLESEIRSCLCRLTEGCELHLDRPYCPCHFWLHETHGDSVLLGLDGHLLRILYPIDDITLPHVGVFMKRGDTCGWITRGRMAVPLRAPITSDVEAVNEAYLDQVRATGGAGGSEDWVVNLRPHEDLDTVPGLYRGEATLAWYLKKTQLIKRYLREAVATEVDDQVGTTLPDGGAPNLNLEEVLGRERFEALVVELFNMQI